MKISDRRQIPQIETIQKPFIDRKLQRERFWKEYDMHKDVSVPWAISALNFYGMGGIGKSELANALSNELLERSITHIFFTFGDDMSFIDNVIEFRNRLFDVAKVSFVYFDTAYFVYCRKSGRTLSELAQKSILNSKYMMALNSLLETLPFKPINVVAAILQVFAPFEKELGRKFQADSFDFYNMSPDKIYNRLLTYFLLDLKDGIRKLEKPFLIILDNLDAKNIFDNIEFRRWILSEKGLVQNIPNIIWALFSREKILGIEFPEKVLQYVPVEEFSYEETMEYLEKCGINHQYWLHIYSLTQGIPLYLYICIEDYYAQLCKKQEIQLAKIGANKEELIHRLLKHMNSDQKKVLQLMAFLEVWSEETFIIFSNAMNVDETAYYEMRDKAFVKRYADKYLLHNVVVNIIQKYTPPAYFKRLHNVYNNIVASLRLDIEITRLLEIKIAIFELDSDDALEKYIFSLTPLFERYVQALEVDHVYFLHNTICRRLMDYPNKIFALSISYYYYGLVLRNMGNDSKALVQMQIAHQYICDILKPVNLKEEIYKGYVITVKGEYANLLFLNGRFDDALELRKICLTEAQRFYGKKSLSTIACMQNLAKQYTSREEYREIGIQMLTKIIKRRKNIDLSDDHPMWEMNERYKIYAEMGLATTYADMEEYEKALKYGVSAITEMIEKFGVSDYDTKVHLENFSDILMRVRAYDLIIDLLEKIFMEWREIMNDDSRVLQSLKYKLGIAYGESKRFEEGKQLLRELYEYSYDTLGGFNKITLRNRKQYAIILAQEGNNSDAIDMLSDCLKTYLECYGKDGDVQLLHMYSSLITEYNRVHNDKMVERLQNEVLKAGNWENIPATEMAMLKALGIRIK